MGTFGPRFVFGIHGGFIHKVSTFRNVWSSKRESRMS